MVAHLHGSHVTPESDGYPEAWWLPNANNLAGFITKGSKYDQFDKSNTEPGTAVYQYANDQRATTLWFHDHTLGMTRTNVYAGPTGFYLLRGGGRSAHRRSCPAATMRCPWSSRTSPSTRRLALLPGQPGFLRRLHRAVHPHQRHRSPP